MVVKAELSWVGTVHFNATEHPTDQWIIQQLRETIQKMYRKYLVLDRDEVQGRGREDVGMPRQ